MANKAFTITISPQARLSYLALASLKRTFHSAAQRCSSGHYHRSDFTGQGFTGFYEPGQPTGGPLGGASIVGAPRITPKLLKKHLDDFVVGQERAKRVLSVAVYNHYQRVQELERLDQEHEEHMAQQQRRDMGHRHPVEGYYRSFLSFRLNLMSHRRVPRPATDREHVSFSASSTSYPRRITRRQYPSRD